MNKINCKNLYNAYNLISTFLKTSDEYTDRPFHSYVFISIKDEFQNYLPLLFPTIQIDSLIPNHFPPSLHTGKFLFAYQYMLFTIKAILLLFLSLINIFNLHYPEQLIERISEK